MYVENIMSLINNNLPLKYKYYEGNIIFGKAINLEEGKNAIRLYDGSIIPSIFISENSLEKDKFMKFKIEGYNNDTIVLKPISPADTEIDNDMVKFILKDLNIPDDEGKKIITSLIKFNLPATDENILKIYKNLDILKLYNNYNNDDILSFLNKFVGSEITENSPEFSFAKEIFSSLKNIDSDFLSFLVENNITADIANIVKTDKAVSDQFFINSFINKFKEFLYNKNNSEIKTISLNDIVNNINENQSFLSSLSSEYIRTLSDNIDILKYLYDNYNMYFFNVYNQNNLYKNNIIIKNKNKNSKYIDVNDVKIYISVDTPKMDTVEGYLQKKNNDLSVLIKAKKEFLPLINNSLDILKKSLLSKNYKNLSIKVEPLESNSNFVSLSNFFNYNIIKKLDVKV